MYGAAGESFITITRTDTTYWHSIGLLQNISAFFTLFSGQRHLPYHAKIPVSKRQERLSLEYISAYLQLRIRTEFLWFRGFKSRRIPESLESKNRFSIPPKELPNPFFVIPDGRNDIPGIEPFRPRIRMVKLVRDRPVSPESFS